jgi:hypothetical protein
MRLQLVVAALLSWVLSAMVAHADGQSASHLSVYTDNDALTVVSPQVRVEQDLIEPLTVTASYDADIISAATVDVRTAASPRGYDEVRHGLLAGVSWRPLEETSLGARYLPSWEPDYRSHGIGTDASHAWSARRLITRLSFMVRVNQVGRSGESPEQWRSLTHAIGGLEQSVIVDARTIASLAYELQHARGYMASPYRYAAIGWPDGSTVRAPEAVPEQRTRHAGRASLRRALASRLFLAGGYRVYGDDWGVISHTGDVELQVEIVHRMLIASASFRGYYQTEATFYEERYEAAAGSLPKRRTADKMLASAWSLLGAVRAELTLASLGTIRALRGVIGVAIYDQHFLQFARLESRRAVIASLGVTAEY